MARRQRATIEFTAVQLGLVAACALGATASIFLFGIYVGRGLPAHHAGINDQVARIPVAEPPKLVAVARGPMAAISPVPGPAAAPGIPAAETPSAASTMDATVAASLAAAAAKPERVPAKPVVQPALRREDDVVAAANLGPVEPAPEALGAQGGQGAEVVTPAVPAVPYTVQVLATRNKTEAEDLAHGLKKQRIGAFVSEVEDTSGSWYRVRIGIYDDLESAQVMETRLRKLGLQQAYVSRYR